MLAAFGTEQQKREYLPGIYRGELCFALGYSEPNAGTDLASLRTRAVRVGDEWVVKGQKIWTSMADFATHVWLAVRTDPDAPKHAGISVLIVPTQSPGLTIRPLHTMYGGHTNETFYDDVRVPAENLVGAVNRGWPIIMHALNHERIGLAALAALVRISRALAAVQCVGSMAQALDAGTATDAQVALAKASASRAAPEVLMLAHQIHGRNGVIEENDLYLFTLRGKERSLAWGTADECLAQAADAFADPVDWS